MTDTVLTRRSLLGSIGAALLVRPAMAAVPEMHVLKDPGCGCCNAWIAILEDDGFAVTTEARAGDALTRYKRENGIPPEMMSCHTGSIDGYMVEGHVPAADIKRLLAERPDAVGLSVPGMPFGSPGMGPETAREAYDVYLIRRDGTAEVFSHYDAA